MRYSIILGKIYQWISMNVQFVYHIIQLVTNWAPICKCDYKSKNEKMAKNWINIGIFWVQCAFVILSSQHNLSITLRFGAQKYCGKSRKQCKKMHNWTNIGLFWRNIWSRTDFFGSEILSWKGAKLLKKSTFYHILGSKYCGTKIKDKEISFLLVIDIALFIRPS